MSQNFQQYLVRNEIFKSMISTNNEDNENQTLAIMDYLKTVETWREKLVFLLHVTSGGPPRATEYPDLMLRNTSTLHRSVFFSGVDMFLLFFYNKSSGQKQDSVAIARYVHPKVQPLLLANILFITKAEQALSVLLLKKDEILLSAHGTNLENFNGTLNILQNAEELNTFRPKKFCGYYRCQSQGRQWSARTIRRIFNDNMIQYFEHNLGMTMWRQLFTFITNKYIENEVRRENSLFNMVHRQMGHSNTIARSNYGNGIAIHDSMDNETFIAFKAASKIWWDYLNL